MKNNILRLALLIVMFSFNTPFFAQDVEVHIGEESKTNRKEGIRSVYRGEDAIIVLKAKYSLIGSTTYILEVFDNKMNLASRNEVELPDRDLMFSEMSYLNGRIYFFMEKYDKKSKVNTIYGTILSEDGKFEKELFEIAQFENEKNRSVNDFTTSLSTDSTHFVIMISPPQMSREQMAKRQFIVLDLNFDEVENTQIDFPFAENVFSISSFQMDAKENIHMLCIVPVEGTVAGVKSKFVEKEARLFTLYKDASAIEEYKLEFFNENAGFISQIKLKEDKLGRLQCAGFYSDRKGNSTRGVFVFTLDPDTKEISDASFQEFTDEYLNKFLSDKQVRKKERKRAKNKENNPYERLHHYRVRDLVMKEGGGFYMVAEFYFHTVTTTTDSKGNTSTTHHYRYNDLMVINVLKDNSIAWSNKVSKYQHTTNDNGYYSGIVMGLNNDNSLNILFNDNIENTNLVEHENISSMKYKKIRTVLVKIDNEGNATKTQLIDAKKSKALLVPFLSPEGKSNDIVLYSKVKGKSKFINVVLH